MSRKPEQIVCSGHTRTIHHIASSDVVDDSWWFASSSIDTRLMVRNGEDWKLGWNVYWARGRCMAVRFLTLKLIDYLLHPPISPSVLWNALNGECLRPYRNRSRRPCHCDGGSKEGANRCIVGLLRGDAQIIDVEVGEVTETFKVPGRAKIHSVDFLHSSDVLVAANEHGFYLYDVRAPKNVPTSTYAIPSLIGLTVLKPSVSTERMVLSDH